MLTELSRVLCPNPLPSLSGNVYCVGRNYVEHAKELQNEIPSEPVIFLKAPSALRAFEGTSVAFPDETFHHELELVLLVGQHLSLGARASLRDIAGVTLGLDLTRRGVQDQLKKKGLPWTIAKSFAGSGLLHMFQAAGLLTDIDFELEVGGERRQIGHSSQMIFNFEAILNYLLRLQALYPGDIIYTGTPAGVGPLRAGDQFRAISRALNIDASGHL
jgi:2-keto-4-pentenoate hydratase/2-oxohepta-3-ene-1,7-dioic acid hydratase in catechol pathway